MISFLYSSALIGQLALFDAADAERIALTLQPELSKGEAQSLAFFVVETSEEIGLHWTHLMAIFFQESSLRLDPKDCMTGASTCTGDFGVGQVNFKTWGEALNLNKHSMLTSYSYSIRKSAEVFKIYKEKYEGKDPKNWWTLYHSKTPDLRKEYQRKVKAVHVRILKDLKANQNERNRSQKVTLSTCRLPRQSEQAPLRVDEKLLLNLR